MALWLETRIFIYIYIYVYATPKGARLDISAFWGLLGWTRAPTALAWAVGEA